jgi:uncharacterized coiled-coil protein SlyX
MVGQALHHERDRVNVLEARVAALETLTREQTSTITKQASTIDEQAGTITDLRDEIKVVGQFAADTRQRAPSRVESRDTRH